MLKYLLAALPRCVAAPQAAETYAIQAGKADRRRGPAGARQLDVIVENGRVARIESGFTAPAARSSSMSAAGR
jgi:hypothetical protein